MICTKLSLTSHLEIQAASLDRHILILKTRRNLELTYVQLHVFIFLQEF